MTQELQITSIKFAQITGRTHTQIMNDIDTYCIEKDYTFQDKAEIMGFDESPDAEHVKYYNITRDICAAVSGLYNTTARQAVITFWRSAEHKANRAEMDALINAVKECVQTQELFSKEIKVMFVRILNEIDSFKNPKEKAIEKIKES